MEVEIKINPRKWAGVILALIALVYWVAAINTIRINTIELDSIKYGLMALTWLVIAVIVWGQQY